MCIEYFRLEGSRAHLQAKLQQPHGRTNQSDNVIEFAIPTDERAIRTAIFSLDIDLAYHRARCADCRSAQRDIEQLPAAA